MFDVGFWEICLVLLVALLVFGPDKLPQVARTTGMWVGKARRMVSGVQQEIERELRIQEMRDAIKQQEQHSLHQFLEETKTNLTELKQPLTELKQPLTELKQPLISPSTTTATVSNASSVLGQSQLSAVNASVPVADRSGKD